MVHVDDAVRMAGRNRVRMDEVRCTGDTTAAADRRAGVNAGEGWKLTAIGWVTGDDHRGGAHAPRIEDGSDFAVARHAGDRDCGGGLGGGDGVDGDADDDAGHDARGRAGD